MTPEEILRESRRRAQRAAEEVGVGRVRKILMRAKRDLDRRIREAEGLSGPGVGSFTAVQARAVLRQVEEVLRGMKPEMRDLILTGARERAEPAARDVIAYLKAADAKFRGTARPLALDEALMFDRAKRGAESTVLRRILTDPAHPARPGVLDRYGAATIGKFEEALAQRTLTAKPWAEVRNDLVKASPFLQGAPASWAERIVRTESMSASNGAAQATIEAADEQLEGGMLKILSATFDSRTAADSYATHGQIRRTSEAFDTWYGPMMHPPDRPNDRGVVVPHRIGWPLPASLKPRSDGEVAARWRAEGRKGSPPPRPQMSTVDLAAEEKRLAASSQPEPNPSAPRTPEAATTPRPVAASPAVEATAPTPRFRNEEQRAAHASQRLADLPASDADPALVRHVLRVQDDPTTLPWGDQRDAHVADLAAELRRMEREASAPPLRQIRIDQVLALDPDLRRTHVTRAIEDARRGEAQRPIIVRHGGKLYAYVGDEEIAAAHLGGRSTVRAHVVDLDAKKPWIQPKEPPASPPKQASGRVSVELLHSDFLAHVKGAGVRPRGDEKTFDANVKNVFAAGMPKIDTLQKTWGSDEAGHAIKLDSVTAWSNKVVFDGKIMAGTRVIGEIVRTFIRHGDGTLEVHHDFFKIDDVNEQGKKGGSAMLRQSIQTYEKIGVKEVTVDAAWVGRYAWATFGYNWNADTARLTAQNLARFMADKGVDRKRAEVIAKGASARAWDVAALDVDGITVAVKSEGKMVDCKIGKAFLLSGGMWSGKIVLDPKHETYQRAKERIGL